MPRTAHISQAGRWRLLEHSCRARRAALQLQPTAKEKTALIDLQTRNARIPSFVAGKTLRPDVGRCSTFPAATARTVLGGGKNFLNTQDRIQKKQQREQSGGSVKRREGGEGKKKKVVSLRQGEFAPPGGRFRRSVEKETSGRTWAARFPLHNIISRRSSMRALLLVCRSRVRAVLFLACRLGSCNACPALLYNKWVPKFANADCFEIMCCSCVAST